MKYMGSKNRIYKPLKAIIERHIENNNIELYIEPFMGGCNLLDKIDAKEKIGSDFNKYLVALFNGIKDGKRITKFYSKKEYYEFAEEFKKGKIDDDFLIGWVGFLFSFNGGFMNSYGGKSNGKKMCDHSLGAIKNILRQTKKHLMKTQLYCRDYKFYKGYKGCLFFMDPPYAGTAKYTINKGGFNHSEFWEFVRELSRENVVLISEYHAPKDFETLWENPTELQSLATKEVNKRPREKLFKYKGEA